MTSWMRKISPRLNIVWQGQWLAGQVEPPRYLYDHELVIVTRGSCVVSFADRAVELSAGDYLIIPPDTFHATTVGTQGVMRHCLHFDWVPPVKPVAHAMCCFYPTRPAKARIAPTPEWVPQAVFHGTFAGTGPVRALIETMVHRWNTGDPLARETCRAVFLELLLRLVWRAEGRTRQAGRATQLAQVVKDLLDRPEQQPENIQPMLESLGFSYPHLCRLFRRTYGVTPAEYRIAVRLERAKVLLRDRRMSVAEAAYAAGFRDPGYFARCFRKQNGVTPTAFR
jgi:AraC-like DNA-binding protein